MKDYLTHIYQLFISIHTSEVYNHCFKLKTTAEVSCFVKAKLCLKKAKNVRFPERKLCVIFQNPRPKQGRITLYQLIPFI